ncbi:MAG: 4'-phosphopantetheinyl transferase superfamily protein [Armatimonadetes bacterium]|nr:4'-phosphopantetheinyl transferase superfamily protein [Armatimonadota bacterium]MDE2205916.1 4'-phosphopantetheinyl transferase superfamily protein [Armatimonadota bacterium]
MVTTEADQNGAWRVPSPPGWREALGFAHALGAGTGARSPNLTLAAAVQAVCGLLPGAQMPEPDELAWTREVGGRPSGILYGSLRASSIAAGYDPAWLQVSNTHERGIEMVAATFDCKVAGIGIDLVQLSRMRRHGPPQLLQMARRFMSADAYEEFTVGSAGGSSSDAPERVAAGFALMEATSKALGAGLRMGLGVGGPLSVRMQSIGVTDPFGACSIAVLGDARDRLELLGCDQLTGACSNDGELVCACVAACRSG